MSIIDLIYTLHKLNQHSTDPQDRESTQKDLKRVLKEELQRNRLASRQQSRTNPDIDYGEASYPVNTAPEPGPDEDAKLDAICEGLYALARADFDEEIKAQERAEAQRRAQDNAAVQKYRDEAQQRYATLMHRREDLRKELSTSLQPSKVEEILDRQIPLDQDDLRIASASISKGQEEKGSGKKHKSVHQSPH